MTSETLPTPVGWKPSDTALMRAAAALLIANSHLESFYPYPWLAGDGLIGNALFFFLSGFGIALGSHSRDRGFFRWYFRRIVRIYPSVILAVLLIQILLLRKPPPPTVSEYVRMFIFPTNYPFIGHVMVVYLVLFWLLKPVSNIPLLIATIACFVIEAIYAIPLVAKWPPGQHLALGQMEWGTHYFYFTGIAYLGALVARLCPRPTWSFAASFVAITITFIGYVALKLVMMRGHFAKEFFVLHLVTAVICLQLLQLSASNGTHSILKKIKPLGAFITLLAGITLEMYIIQSHTEYSSWMVSKGFPIDLIIFWPVTIIAAVILAKAANLTRVLLGLQAGKAKPPAP